MSDLIERLRGFADAWHAGTQRADEIYEIVHHKHGEHALKASDLVEAADYITTLEAKLAVAREALGQIAEREGYTAETPNDYNRGWNAGRFRARQTAEQALQEIDQ